MTVGELIQRLKELSEDAEVFISYQDSDYFNHYGALHDVSMVAGEVWLEHDYVE